MDGHYIAPLGPQVDAFEQEFAEYVGIEHCVAVSSGTAAMHLALRCLGVGPAPVECASLSPAVNSTGQGDDPSEMRPSTIFLTYGVNFAPHLHEFHRVKVIGDDDRETNDKRPFVIASTLTFIGSVTSVVFQGAIPAFVD